MTVVRLDPIREHFRPLDRVELAELAERRQFTDRLSLADPMVPSTEIPNSSNPYHPTESWLHNFGQDDKWNFCLRVGKLLPADQEIP
jgi:hypothetical protein